jgi:zinc protease
VSGLAARLRAKVRTSALGALGALLIVPVLAPVAGAVPVERIVSPGGIEAWLVREPSVPLVSMEFAFLGGTSQDPAGKGGAANMVAHLLDEGAGELDAKTFQTRMEERAIEINFSATRDFFRGTLRTLGEHRAEAIELLKPALSAPRFDAEAVERIRAQVISGLRRETTSPNSIASKSWWGAAFPDHPYGRPVSGALETVPQITADDLRSYTQRVFARDQLKIAIVGDIDAAAAGDMIDRVFGALPAKAQLTPVADARPEGIGRRLFTPLDVPQTVMTFGGPGIQRKDPDFIAAYLVNHILGGGSFSSRLYAEIREKRGLAYSVYDSLVWLRHSAMFMGGTQTRADRATETLQVIEQEIQRLAEAGPSADELRKAKDYLKGSYMLSLDTSSKIASQLVQIQIDELGIDYIKKRNGLIDAVSLDDAKRVAKRLLGSGLLVTVVGRQQGATPTAIR